MMPECSKRKCKRIAEVYLGKTRINLEDDWQNPLYLCEKHAKEFIEKYGLDEAEPLVVEEL